MSVQLNNYHAIGKMFEWKEFYKLFESEDQADEFMEKHDDSAFGGIENKEGITILADGYNGKYIFVGHVLAKTDEGENFSDPIRAGEVNSKREEVLGYFNKCLDGKHKAYIADMCEYFIPFYR